MAADQAVVAAALPPIPVPISSPRLVSMNGVNGWYSAKARNPAGIESVGTNPLPRNGRNTSGMGRLLADSTFLAARPSATASQVKANVIIARMPTAAAHSTGLAVG